jgi:hypothetical protein
VDKDNFVSICVAEELTLRPLRTAARQGYVRIAQQGHTSGDRVASAAEHAGLEVVVAEHR